MNKLDLILNQKEANGLRITFLFRSLVLIIISISHIYSHHTMEELVRVFLLSAFFFSLCLYALFLIRYGNHLGLVGYLGVCIDAFLMCFLPYNWYLSVGFIENVQPSYLLKTSLPTITFIFVGLNALALRPLYPIIIGLLFNMIWLFFFYLVYNDPRTVITDNFIDNFFTPSIVPGYYISYIYSVSGLAVILAFLTYSYRKSIHEAVQLEVQNNQMERYFSPNVLSKIKEVESIFQAKKSNVVVIFTDIRSFTNMSETLSPENVVQFLREYHSMMITEIYKYGGTIDKFIGDGIMITFGTPMEKPDDCERALSCALAMRSSLIEFNKERAVKNLPPIRQGIGMHYGEAITGNVGSENRLEYTVIGDTVNVASRIEAQCKETEKDLLFSSDFASRIDAKHAMSLVGNVSIRGKKESIDLFTIE